MSLRPAPAFIALVAAGSLAHAAVLVGVDEPWRLLPATALPAGSPWTDPAFPDASWHVGRSGFGTVSYGEQTSLASLPGDARTVLFRRAFLLDTTNGLGAVVLRIDYRDGFVAHLNGREIARRNLPLPPGTPVPPDTLPVSRWPGSAEDIAIGFAADLLQPGTNLLAIQVHSDSDLERPLLVPELLTDFTRGPYLQASGPGAMSILWRTAESLPARVRFGPEGQPASTTDLPAGTRHVFTATRLVPGTRYEYSIALRHPDGTESRSDTFRFRALPDRGPIRIGVIGDSGAGTAAQFAVARGLEAAGVDLVLHAGDIIYPSFVEGLTDTRCLSVYRRQMATTPFAFAWGNHDLHYGTGPVRAMILPPTNSEPAEVHLAEGTTPQSYYSFDAGEAHVAVVFQTILSQYAFRTNSAQYRWLEADLASTTKPWKIVIAHHPIATSGGHRFTDYNANGLPDWQEFADVLLPLLQRHGVQLYLSGHDHVFERFLPRDGLHAVVTGGGGTHLYWWRGWDNASAQLHITHHFTRLHIDQDTLHIEAVHPDGRTFDRFQIRQSPTPPQLTAIWSSPTVESHPATNADGNILGQRFDLDSAPEIPARTGRFANLGRARVALDHSHLHIGFDSLLLPPEADLVLFLGVPGLPGVTGLAGLGNGVPDPAGEGVDALDAFENLRFEGFRPAIAAVLGDELADSTQRGFRRPGHGIGLGQGVFRLETGLPTVPGVRLQQFNRSPQDSLIAPEQNADFIELSIPRSQLGNLGPESSLQLAVVAASRPDLLRQTRPVDSGHIGSSLTTAPDGSVTLTAVTVRLPRDPDPDRDGLTETEEAALGTDPNHPDTDRDGLTDGWEWRHDLDPRSAQGIHGPDGDPDGDGFGNRVEQAAGGDPRDPATPVLRLAASRLADGGVELQWPIPLGGVILESAASPEGPWDAVARFPGVPGTTHDRHALMPGNGEACFRLRRP